MESGGTGTTTTPRTDSPLTADIGHLVISDINNLIFVIGSWASAAIPRRRPEIRPPPWFLPSGPTSAVQLGRKVANERPPTKQPWRASNTAEWSRSMCLYFTPGSNRFIPQKHRYFCPRRGQLGLEREAQIDVRGLDNCRCRGIAAAVR